MKISKSAENADLIDEIDNDNNSLNSDKFSDFGADDNICTQKFTRMPHHI